MCMRACMCTASTNPCGFIRPPMFLSRLPHTFQKNSILKPPKKSTRPSDGATVFPLYYQKVQILVILIHLRLMHLYGIRIPCVYNVYICMYIQYTSGFKDKPRNSTDLPCNLGISQPADIGNRMNTRAADRDSCVRQKKLVFQYRDFGFLIFCTN